jgi:hypothetical protein
MKNEGQGEALIDLDTVECILSSLALFGCAQGCMASRGFNSRARSGEPGEAGSGESSQ